MLKNFLKSASLVVALVMSATGSQAQDYTVRFAVDGFVLGTLPRVAVDQGYFAEEGVDAQLLTFSYGTDTVDAVLAGQADFGVIIDMPLLTRLSVGQLKVPAFMGAPLPGWHKLYAPQDYTSPEDLRGLRIAVAQGTAQDFVTRTFLTDGGLNPDTDVELVSLPSLFEIIGAMKSGRVDAAWIWGQGVEQLGDDAKFSFVADDSIVDQSTTAMLGASRTYVEENPEASAAILRALVKAAEFTQSDIEGAAQIVADGISGDAAAIATVITGQNFGISFNADSMASFVAKHAFLTAADKLDPTYNLAEYVDLDLLRVAMPDGDIVAAVE